MPLLLSLLPSLACYGGDDAESGAFAVDTGRDTGSRGETAEPVDTDSGGDTGGDTGTEPAPTLWELTEPCSGGTPYALYFSDASTGFVGCGSGMGLYATTDGGDTLAAAHPASGSGNFFVNQIVPDPSGGVLVCGHDYTTEPDPLLLRYRDGAWTALLTYGSNTKDPASAQMSGCGVVAAAGDGALLVASETVGDMTRSMDNGLTWTAEYRYWEDENLNEGGYAYYYMLNLVAAGGAYYGAGSQITEPPVFFAPSAHPAGDWYNFAANPIASLEGEVWALATPDGGATWFAGGRDQARTSEASGFFFRSDDGGRSWTDISLGGSVDIMHDVKFAADGLHGVAVGHRYPTSKGGFIAVTEDGGQTWTERSEKVPLLFAAAIVDDTFWVSGDAFLARGVFATK